MHGLITLAALNAEAERREQEKKAAIINPPDVNLTPTGRYVIAIRSPYRIITFKGKTGPYLTDLHKVNGWDTVVEAFDAMDILQKYLHSYERVYVLERSK